MYQKWTLKRHTVVSVVHIDCGLGNRVLPVIVLATSWSSSLPASARTAPANVVWVMRTQLGLPLPSLFGHGLGSGPTINTHLALLQRGVSIVVLRSPLWTTSKHTNGNAVPIVPRLVKCVSPVMALAG